MEDFEKKYEKSLKYLKTFIDGDCVTESDILADFPELRESEDERMPKARARFVHNFLFENDNKKMVELYTDEIPKDKNVVWAVIYPEKPKEQKATCDGCAKHLEGYIDGRNDAENKLLEKYGIVETPDDKLEMKARWMPSEEQIECLRKVVYDAEKKHAESTSGYNDFIILRSLLQELIRQL